MISKLKRTVIGNYVLSLCAMYFYRIFNKSSGREISRRKEISIFEYEELAKELNYYPLFPIKDNNLYGLGYVLNKKLDLDFNKNLIEHGLIFGSLVQEHSIRSYAKGIITFSNYREKFINKYSDKKIYKIGPYIQYAENIFDEEVIAEYKRSLGSVLLVFPSHSITDTDAKYNVEEFCLDIHEKSVGFDSVIVCLYWKDILNGYDLLYKEKGYLIVTAGHSYDYNFLSRLKTIINLSDFMITNNIGTHLIYSAALGKGCFVYDQEVKYFSQILGSKELNQRNDDDLQSYQRDTVLLKKAFGERKNNLTKEQRKLCEFFGGIVE